MTQSRITVGRGRHRAGAHPVLTPGVIQRSAGEQSVFEHVDFTDNWPRTASS
jgi:hypothetical protein